MPGRTSTRGRRAPRPENERNEERAVTTTDRSNAYMREIAVAVADRQEQLASLLAGQIDVDRFITVALQMVQGDPKLLRCTKLSILSSIRDAATYGLEPAGMLGDAAIVPYHDTASNTDVAQLQIEYRGLRKLALRDGTVKAIDADLVYEGDDFQVISGSSPAIHHVPNLQRKAEANVLGGYAWARLANGELLHLWMSLAEILQRRDVSRAWKYAEGPNGKHDSIWHKWPKEQMKKTVLRRFILEKLPLNPVARQALVADTKADSLDQPIVVTRPNPSGDARDRVLARMGLGDRPALGSGDTPATPPESGRPDTKPDADAQSGASADSGAPGPSETVDASHEPANVRDRTNVTLCAAPSPYPDDKGGGCRKLAGHEKTDEPGALMHKGSAGETWKAV